jgi:hypothetical protein
MAISVKHKFVSAIPDAGDPTIVQPSNWNDTHDLTGFGTSATLDAGVANGVATLDGSGTVPISQLPSAVLGALSYQGTWNASTNTPTLTSSVGTKGYYYVVNVAGSTNLNGITDWKIGDWAVYNGSIWQKVDNTDQVTSVNGLTGTVVLGYGDITTGVVAVANGGTGVTSSSGANSVVLRDANGNITTNCVFEGYVTQAASGTAIVLTAASAQNYQITGSGGQIIRLPSATTLPSGATFTFNNNQSSGAITVQNNSSTTIATINSGGYVTVVLLDNSTAAGTWDRHDSTPSNVSWSTNTLDYPGSITSATWNGATVAVNRGGTGAATLTGYVKGSGTAALTANATIPTTDLSGTISNAQLANSTISGVALGSNLFNLTAGTGVSFSTGTTYNGSSAITINATGSSGTVTSVTATAPVASTGGTTPVISMPAATTSVSGYLTSTDWNTFNNKTNATASYSRTAFTATASQTTFSVTYTVGYVEVFLNGVLLNSADYTASNGTTVVLAVGVSAGSIVEFIAYNTVATGSVAGSNTQVQYNNGGALGASSSFTFDGTDLNIPFGTSNSPTSSAKIALALSMTA